MFRANDNDDDTFLCCTGFLKLANRQREIIESCAQFLYCCSCHSFSNVQVNAKRLEIESEQRGLRLRNHHAGGPFLFPFYLLLHTPSVGRQKIYSQTDVDVVVVAF